MEKGELRLQEDKLERLTQMVDELEKENVHEGELESFIGVLQHVTRPIFPLTCHCITEDSHYQCRVPGRPDVVETVCSKMEWCMRALQIHTESKSLSLTSHASDAVGLRCLAREAVVPASMDATSSQISRKN